MTLDSLVNPYRLYLRAELAKLRNMGDAQGFLDRGRCDLDRLGLPPTAPLLTHAFADQEAVDAFIDRLLDPEAVYLTSCCGRWRNNGVSEKLAANPTARLRRVPIGHIRVRHAESSLRPIFDRHGLRLVPLARDPELLASAPYSDHAPGDMVAFDICIAEPESGAVDEYRLLDGMHRAIQMVRNGERQITLCVLSPNPPKLGLTGSVDSPNGRPAD